MPRGAPPPQYVPKVEIHEPPNIILPPDVYRGLGGIHYGPRSYDESIDTEERNHVQMSVALTVRKPRMQMLHAITEQYGLHECA